MASDDSLRDALARAMHGFAAVVADLDEADWDQPSMCDGWSIGDVVEHIIGGDRFARIVLGGGTLDEAIATVFGVDHLGDDPTVAVVDASTAARAAFADSLDRLVDHPVGRIPARRFIGFRVFDQLGHTWDIAAALDRPVVLDPVAVSVALDIAEIERAMIDSSPHFADAPKVDDTDTAADADTDSDEQDRFLRAIGRSV
ncbi:MAG: TIGR03086 family metal-binding protein [Actinomycetota bacterium]